jgi:uncharacterized membrane protein
MSDRHETHAAGDEKLHFFDNPKNVQWIFRLLYAIAAILFLVDFVFHRHVVHPWEGIWGFYPIYGFVGIVVLVLLAKQLRRVVMRGEDYYDVD